MGAEHLPDILLDELPFEPPTDTLKSVIRKKYLARVAKWLLGKNEGRILAEESNSNWESALTIMFFVELREIFLEYDEEDEFCDKIPTICAEVSRHLLRKKIGLSDHYVCWDKVTWDTAVVVRALLKILNSYPDKFSESDRRELIDSVTKAFNWLFMRFEKWETEVKYPFGPADVAQILLTTTFFKENYKIEYDKMFENYPLDNDISIEEQICSYLFKIKQINTKSIDGFEENIVSWGDFFQTAETIDSLATYYTTLNWNENKELLNEIDLTCKQALRFIEHEQSEDSGTWGTHADTIRTLYAYVKVPKLLSDHGDSLDPEPHIVFKALRWICDEKQCFDDGSFLHTMFLTIFMCDAFLEIHNNWPLADKPILNMYDDVVWASPVRTTSERTMRFAAETDKQKIADDLDHIEKKLDKRDKIIFTIIFSIMIILIFIIIAVYLGLIVTSSSISDMNSLITLAATILAIYISILIFTYQSQYGG